MLKWSSFTLKTSTESDFTKLSGREFQSLIVLGKNETLKTSL